MIAYRPVPKGRGSNIPHEVVDTACVRHPDGFGIAWREDGALRVERFGPEGKERFRTLLRALDTRSHVEYVAHFRFATHGPKAESHAHPYEYTDPEGGRVLVFHNGVIGITTLPDESDTEVFVRDVLARLPARWWQERALRWLVGESIGWSRLVLMTADETVNLHEKDGKWDNGIWYSSEHRALPVTGYYAYTAGKGWGPEVPSPATARIVSYTAPKTHMSKAERKAVRRARRLRPVPVSRALALVTSEDAATFAGASVIRHGGHTLSDVRGIDRSRDGEWTDALMCDECYTVGDAWVVDGTIYPDIGHRWGPLATDDDEAAAYASATEDDNEEAAEVAAGRA